ncbi:MAG: beta-ketoacyl synthase, partial [Bacteroidales bacterium]|nr:beta-ketoacyl synthase [Bacteroidales bacterium]
GHTLGAAGVMEVVLSSIALQKQMVLRSLGSQTPGTIKPLKVCMQNASSHGNALLRLLSGFGGCNAALLFCLELRRE